MDIDHDELKKERLKSPFESGMITTGRKDQSDNGSGGSSGKLLSFLVIICLVMVCALGFFLYKTWTVQRSLYEQVSIINQQIEGLSESTDLIADRLETDQERMDSMSADLNVLGQQLGVTASQLQRARAEAARLREEQERNVEALTDQIREKADTQRVASLSEETNTKFDEIGEEITEVKEDVTASRQEIEKTWKELTSLGLRLTEQGNLVATNSEGLDELRKRGERDYLEFDALKKSKIKVGDVVVELRKADRKRQRADLKLFYDDREVEKKKVYTNNPLTFYVGRERVPYEFVINEVRKDQILGYISVPKGVISSTPNLSNTSSGG